ncbi:hypothetical protein [Anaerotruncus colihominis]|jgi:hypothetical protein|uniref:Uncharacterized protein n=2 Tax=Anaerotruncus colihominis TaxID=169435 RepID=B0P604_9FIRM|nr:hypothetical protein [Anaerotruncus colihominis]EDS13161.1 hypothetical protein ANACOL_00176 [Anaerotruncus colihominis DSM 17241]MCQ4735171.1 hypothetical protein [Anaerotruncus colihominis]RGE66676.1 hypothetical protein DXC40_12940 [Anaerotruncus colihominis]UWN75730.1 hypothetical protein NQ528_03915 [Anaerotruncus colihominis]
MAEIHKTITEDTEVSTTELACILGITGRYVRQMAEDGVLSKVDKGRFLLAESVQKYIKYTAKDAMNEEDIKLDKAKRTAEVTLKASKAQVAKLEAEEMKGKMHRAEDVEAMTSDLVYAIRGALIALPGRLAVDVAAVESPAEASEIIRKEVYKVMRELANYRYDPQKYEELVRERRDWDIMERDGDDE